MLSEELMFRRRALMAQRQEQSNVLYEAYNLSFNGVNDYIDTGVYLFTQENLNRDFEFIAEITPWSNTDNNATIICAKHNGNNYGFLVRANGLEFKTYTGSVFVSKTDRSEVVIRRINGIFTLSGTNITNLGVSFVNNAFNWSLHLGCAIDDRGTRYRYAKGTIDHIIVRWL